MTPLVSIVVPFYNHKDGLARLFASIAAQSIAENIEIVLVDDCSTEYYADVVDSYRNNAIQINVVRLDGRQYTKNARLRGVLESKGKIIAFADADDILWGIDTLEYHAQILWDEKADIVHFPTVLLNTDYTFVGEYGGARPLANRLQGLDIFRKYLETAGHKATLWSKIYTRSLLLGILDEARGSSVRRYREDILLSTYLYFSAQKYIGSERVGYGHRRGDKDVVKAAGRALSSYCMLQELVPYLRNNGCPNDLADLFAKKQHKFMVKNINILRDTLYSQEVPCISDCSIASLLEHGDFETVIGMLRYAATKDVATKVARLQRSNRKLGKVLTWLRRLGDRGRPVTLV